MAISFAMPAIAGQNFGARHAARARETFRTGASMNVAFMVGLTPLCRWRPERLVGGFSSDAAVLEVAAGFITIVSLNFVTSGLTFTPSGTFQAMGNTLPSLAATGSRFSAQPAAGTKPQGRGSKGATRGGPADEKNLARDIGRDPYVFDG